MTQSHLHGPGTPPPGPFPGGRPYGRCGAPAGPAAARGRDYTLRARPAHRHRRRAHPAERTTGPRHQRRPRECTSYKEFDRAFAPRYANGTTVLTPGFFAEVRDGARVTLTFHYRSGARVTYHVTRSGTSVVGTAS
ncbi:hypothetical protein [Streptomyces sp. CNQ085]|uniref:hypothetical protein n=1 Tax=Streptomyces sp. CNQ085 TaxID=2886944 RepID=UPI002676A9D2|nr:hypothetical protein [Streptomyces sp. CNQ085]